ncbi:phage tail protein [Erwinia sp. AnSW2-5]|uniref:phage tail protein n=1 Tax=Erwinia sp. AnSW2-5 TaxID=3367692 RepID=UPI00385D1ECF
MHRIDTPTAQVDKFGVGKNGFTAGNPQTGQLPTALDETFFDAVQEEISAVIEGAGNSLDKESKNQLLTALKKLFFQSGNNLSEIATAGSAAQQTAQTNLGIGRGSLYPVGAPIPWPLAIPPAGFLALNGQAFNTIANPQLAMAYPAGVFPDQRGRFIRGWDNERGVDIGRVLLSEQGDAARPITGSVEGRNSDTTGRIFSNSPTGAFVTSGTSGSYAATTLTAGTPADRLSTLSIDSSRLGNTANENRPSNIAYNFIVRAA